jgi:hypothetical protein
MDLDFTIYLVAGLLSNCCNYFSTAVREASRREDGAQASLGVAEWGDKPFDWK